LEARANAWLLRISADVKGFHYDANAMLNEVIYGTTHRAQFGQSLTISHPVSRKLTISGEIWHFTQPFLRATRLATTGHSATRREATLCLMAASIMD
jgi:hypothetical protein